MISFIRGTLESKPKDSIIVECRGIGYEIYIPLSVHGDLPSLGEEMKIYTEMYVREDLLRLYGFLSEDDIDVFRQLISVSGIGPKGALGILSSLSPDALRLAVLTENVAAISQAKGIGKKTASKLIIELKDKLKPIDLDSFDQTSVANSSQSCFVDEALLALTTLGYTQTESMKGIRHAKDTSSTEVIIKQALSYLAKE